MTVYLQTLDKHYGVLTALSALRQQLLCNIGSSVRKYVFVKTLIVMAYFHAGSSDLK